MRSDGSEGSARLTKQSFVASAVCLAVFVGRASSLGAQAPCAAHVDLGVHYRWQQKTDLSAVDRAPIRTTSVAQMLTWRAPGLSANDSSWCAERSGRERRVYHLTGWARRYKIESGAGDGDWHIELTGSKAGDIMRCIVVEIPPAASVDSIYWKARQDFLRVITLAGSTVNAGGDILPPVRVTVTGLAFFDGEHRGAEGTDKPPSGHGRCNSATSALWEIHPVYRIGAPLRSIRDTTLR